MSEIDNTTQTLQSLEHLVERVIEKQQGNKWVLDKKIPIGFLLGLVIHTGAIVWYASKMDSRIEKAEEKIVAQQGELVKRGDWMASTNDRMVRMETTLSNVNDVLKDVKDILQKRK